MKRITLSLPRKKTRHFMHFCIFIALMIFIPIIGIFYPLVWLCAAAETRRWNERASYSGFIDD